MFKNYVTKRPRSGGGAESDRGWVPTGRQLFKIQNIRSEQIGKASEHFDKLLFLESYGADNPDKE